MVWDTVIQHSPLTIVYELDILLCTRINDQLKSRHFPLKISDLLTINFKPSFSLQPR